jgi:hypothetical protein
MNPIPQNSIDDFYIKFSKNNLNIINNLSILLTSNENLTPPQ